MEKGKTLDRVVSYVIEHEFNPGSVYVVKDINKKYVEYLSEPRILEQPDTTRFTKKLLLALPNLWSKIMIKKSILELNLKCQKESIPKKLLFLTKALIDGFNHDEVNFSQEPLAPAQIIVSNATKKDKNEKRPNASLST